MTVRESLKEWFIDFIEEHLNRIIFSIIVLSLAGIVNWGFDKSEEAFGVLMLIIGAFIPEIRTPNKKRLNDEKSN